MDVIGCRVHHRQSVFVIVNPLGDQRGAPRKPAPNAAILAAAASEFRVTAIRAMRGPNYWRLAPVVACDLRQGIFEGISSASIQGFTSRLLDALPSLVQRRCNHHRAGFGRALVEGSTLPHVLEHVALELQALAGSDQSFSRVVPSEDLGVWWVIVAYEEEELGLACMNAAARLIRACIRGESLQEYLPTVVGPLRDLHEEVRLGPSTAAIVDEAMRRGIPVRRLDSLSRVQLGLGCNLRRVQATLTDSTSAIAMEIAQDKSQTKQTLAAHGLPVPVGRVVGTLERALLFVERQGYPVLIKPLDGNQGRGVSARLTDHEGVVLAFAMAQETSAHIIVERFHEGHDHRVLVVGGRVVACAERVPAQVVGDGRRSIRDLIAAANRDPRRGKGHRKVLTLLPDDHITLAFLGNSGLDLATVPAPGAVVPLRGTANLSTGGTSIDRTDHMHPENVAACEIAAGAIGLDIAGIDLITTDISIPFRDNGAVIVEVNAAPGLRMHTHPTEGRERRVAEPILDMLYPAGSESRIPVLAVTGTNGKTTTVRLLAHLFRRLGEHVGFTTTDGVYVQDALVVEGDMAGPYAANVILANPKVTLAVLETARGGLLRAGLGFEDCDIGIVLNVTADHLGLGGINTLEQLADLKGVVAAVVRPDGYAILNADEPLVYRMRERCAGQVALFSDQEAGSNPALEEHSAAGGISACMHEGQFAIRRAAMLIPIAAEQDVPLMMGGAARFQRQNILAAALAAYVRGMQPEVIRDGLLSFVPSPTLTPGRLNVIPLSNGARAVVDYAHNPAAMDGIIEMVQALPARRRLAAIAMPGDRRDDDIRLVAAKFAAFDGIILKEDGDLRGRTAGEVPTLLRRALVDAGLADAAIETVPQESAAVRRGLAMLESDDLLLVVAEDVRGTLAIVAEHAQQASP